MRGLFLVVIVLILTGLLAPHPVHSQILSSGIATYVKIADKSAQAGDIVKFSDKGYVPGNVAYEPAIFGVIVESPAISLESDKIQNAKPVVSSGKAYVRVTSKNGQIASGDLITTSEVKGVGQKATENGYVLGTALEDYKERDPKKIGRILVQLNITYNGASAASKSQNLLSSFSTALSSPYLTPLNALRYIFAAGIVLIALLVSAAYFGRMATTGVEALGRNPLAGKSITVGIVINVTLGIGIIALAISVAYLILTI